MLSLPKAMEIVKDFKAAVRGAVFCFFRPKSRRQMSIKIIVVSIFLAIIFVIGCPSFATQESYPQIAISGYKRWLRSELNVDPVQNYFLAIGDRLPSGSGGPWSEQLELGIEGKLFENLNVSYGLKQIPNTPERYDIDASFYNYSLLFGSQAGLFSNQEYIIQDYPIGAAIGGKWDRLKANVFTGAYPSGQIASPTANYSSYKLFRNPDYTGNKVSGSFSIDNPYLEYLSLDLGRADIIDDFLEIYLDDRPLIRNSDFFFDEAYGLALISGRFKNAKAAKINYLLKNGEKKERTFDFNAEAQRRAFLSPEFRIIDGSEIVTVDGVRLTRDLDYRVNYNLGLFIMNRPLHEDAEVRIDFNYNYGANLYASEIISGQAGTIFNLSHKNIVGKSETVTKNNSQLQSGYLMDYTNGKISFTTPLTTADTVEVSYSYTGVRQQVEGANVEYKLSNWSKIGSSAISLTPSKNDEWLYDQITPSGYFIWNLYNNTTFNENTFVNTEISFSNRNVDIRNNLTSEADSALKVFGRTRFGNLELNGTYRKTGLNFASVRKVKLNTDWAEEKSDLSANYKIFDNFSIKIGYENGTNQTGNISSPEAKISTDLLGLNYAPFEFWNINYDIRRSQQVTDVNKNSQRTISVYSDLDIRALLQIAKSFSEDIKTIYKYYDGRITAPDSTSMVTTKSTKSRYGCYAKFIGGLSSYVQYDDENDVNDAPSPLSVRRTTPLYRVAYKFDFGGGHALEIYSDYSTTQQRGSTAYDKNDYGYGLLWNFPIDNPVLSSFQIGTAYKRTTYMDINDPANNYAASEIGFQGTMVF